MVESSDDGREAVLIRLDKRDIAATIESEDIKVLRNSKKILESRIQDLNLEPRSLFQSLLVVLF
jgi:hypothetical protein